MIKWAGIVDDPAKYQRGELPPNARRLAMPESMGDMMLRALPFIAPGMFIAFAAMFVRTRASGAVVVSFPFVAAGVVIGMLLMIVHELLHAVVYPKEATVYIGIMPKQFAAVALASWPLSRGRFAAMSLMPAILGIVPLALFMMTPPDALAVNGALFGMAVMGLISTYADYFNVVQVMRQTKPGERVQFFGDDTYAVK